MSEKQQKIGLGGGCHWCTEAVFQALQGVALVRQGFIRSVPPNEDWSEAVLISYHPDQISLRTLIEIHLRTHASTSAHSLRKKYRSAIYAVNPEQQASAEAVLEALQREFEKPLITSVLAYRTFKASDEMHQNYYAKNPERPFCRTYIDPKLKMLRQRFSAQI